MSNVRSLSRSFAAGELTPELFGRVDLDQFQTGLALCRNFETLPHGPAMNRAGFAYVLETLKSSKRSRVISFTYSITQTMILEFGDGYIRFHTFGATVLEPEFAITGVSSTAPCVFTAPGSNFAIGDWVNLADIVGPSTLNGRWGVVTSPTADTFELNDLAGHSIDASTLPAYVGSGVVARAYTLATPYAEADLFDLHYVQSADVLTITHPNYPPAELRRLGATNWSLVDISFVPAIAAPAGVAAVATPGSGTPNNVPFSYVVTALSAATSEESLASAVATCSNDLTLKPAKNVITWGAVAGASRYNVYSYYQGLYAYIGQTESLTFTDNNITADTGLTPPELINPFGSATNYPQAVGYDQQRRCFASTLSLPQSMWMTRSGTESNMSASTPSRDDDAITFRIAAREANTILHIVSLAELVLLTSSAEWAVTANGSATAALTPSTLSVQPQGYTGSTNVVPVTVQNSLLYANAMGGHISEMTYNYYAGGYVSDDISIMAPHLFDFFTIKDMAYSKAPYPIVWCVRSDGTLLGLTYSPTHKVAGWHHHDTLGGSFESVAVVTEGQESALYAVVNRTINGRQVRYIERLHSRQVDVLTDSFFVDAGVEYSGAPVNSVIGLYHLEGQTVSILADGAVQPPQVVANGAVVLPVQASTIVVGIPITADMQTLPFSFSTLAFGQGRAKNVNKVWVRLHNSSGFSVGQTFDKLTPFKQRTTEPYGSPPAMVTGEYEITVMNGWNQDGSVCIRQTAPLPLIVSSMTIEASVGG